MCTVVTRHQPGRPLRVLALRDEVVSREFDEPAAWWPDQPNAVGGRDRLAGGTWCASDVQTGATALLVNRIERREGTPSRGLLPLAALAHGDAWTEAVDHRAMASFNLVLARPDAVTVWVWDAETLQRRELEPGTHMITSRGVDADDEKTVAYAPRFAAEHWRSVVASTEPLDAIGALVVRVPFGDEVYATVFGQLITSVPGELDIVHSRTPWLPETWSEQRYPAAPERRAR
ncbi:MAG: NRDE family protein [Jatrophihabitans sp.]|uniref:NRDE family protein n=1 Tax=Jatrophihabitans sp. TaxID=1932789 RepID=UPI003F80F2AD